MDAAEFDHYLHLKLCWLDRFPTSNSHAGQRQCPHCRRKWSYAGTLRRWILAREYCQGSTRRAAARVAGTGVHTAGRHFRRFEEAVGEFFLAEMRHEDSITFADPERMADYYTRILKVADPHKRKILIGELFLREWRMELRLELLFRLIFRDPLRKLIHSALSAHIGSRGVNL